MASDLTPESPQPSDAVTDNDRMPVLQRIQHAVATDALEFDELDDRFDAVYAATTRAELETVAADLPASQAPLPVRPEIGHPAPTSTFSIAGDIEIGGWLALDGDLQTVNLIGDSTIDLSSAALPDEVVVTVHSVIGDRRVIVPDGARAVLETQTILGSKRVDLSEPRPGMPTIRVRGVGVVGDVQLFSLSRVPESLFRRIWKKLSKA